MGDTALPPSLPPTKEDLTQSYVPVAEPWVEGDHPTDNPDGVTVSNVDYSPKTQEEKAELLFVEMVEPVETAPEEPYPLGDGPWESREDLLARIHAPIDLVSAEDWNQHTVDSLAAGGALTPEEYPYGSETAPEEGDEETEGSEEGEEGEENPA